MHSRDTGGIRVGHRIDSHFDFTGISRALRHSPSSRVVPSAASASTGETQRRMSGLSIAFASAAVPAREVAHG